MNAIDFLIKEHDAVRKTLAEIDSSPREQTKMRLFNALCQDLLRHETMEHQLWYPHFKNDQRLSATVKHLLGEEKGAEKAIKKLTNLSSYDAWQEQFARFKKDVEHHAAEEENDLFPEVLTLLSPEDLEQIGLDMHHFKVNHPHSIH